MLNTESKKDTFFLSSSYDSMFIPKRFADEIIVHVVSNYLENNYFFKPPLYLVIEGDPGEGKTIQSIAVCNQKRIAAQYISASQLSGKNESESKQILEDTFNESLQLIKSGIYIAIVIDDFHLGNANYDSNIKRTVNSDILISYMMNLAESCIDNRIPIILTGNNFKKVYPPLIRDGRANIFKWEPTYEEKEAVIKSIYGPYMEKNDCNKLKLLINRYKDQNIAFFSQLLNDYRSYLLKKEIEGIKELSPSVLKNLSEITRKNFLEISYDKLKELAQIREKNRRL